MRGPHATATAMLGARLAGAHDAGKVVLLDVVEDQAVAELERELLSKGEVGDSDVATDRGEPVRPSEDEAGAGTADGEGGGDGTGADKDDGATSGGRSAREVAEERLGEEAVSHLERRADRIEAAVDVPCQVIVAADGGDPAGTVLDAARGANCDLIVAPRDVEGDRPSTFARTLLAGELDVLLHRSSDGRANWRSVLVAVRKPGDVAHAMIDFALRLADRGRVSVCHCIDTERERRDAEEMLANLVETVSDGVETRVAREGIDAYLERTAGDYDLVIVGASTDRSVAWRFVAPPTFRRLADVDCDVAVVHRG